MELEEELALHHPTKIAVYVRRTSGERNALVPMEQFDGLIQKSNREFGDLTKPVTGPQQEPRRKRK